MTTSREGSMVKGESPASRAASTTLLAWVSACRSEPQMPQASVRTSISPVAGSGSGTVSTTSWDPRMTAARMSRISSSETAWMQAASRMQRSSCRATRAHARRRRWPHRDPRPRGARGERLPRSQPAGESAARLRWAGGGAGAGRRGPDRRSRNGALPARLLPPPRRPGDAHPLHGGPHPRRPDLHHAARGRHPARRGHLQPGRVLPTRGGGSGARGRDAGRARSGDAPELRGAPRQGARHASRRPAGVAHRGSTDRAPPRGGGQPVQADQACAAPAGVDPRQPAAPGRSPAASVRGRVRLRPVAARHRNDAARDRVERSTLRHGEPRSRDVVPPHLSRRRVAAVRTGEPGGPWRARLHHGSPVHARRAPVGERGAGRADPAHRPAREAHLADVSGRRPGRTFRADDVPAAGIAARYEGAYPRTMASGDPGGPSVAGYTSEQYMGLVELGLLNDDDRVELLDGVIVTKSPSNPRNAGAVWLAQTAVQRAVADRAMVRIQSCLVAGTHSVPEPDVAVVPWQQRH